MKKSVVLFAVFCISFYNNAQDSVSVLFIGNSYTYVIDLPLMIENLASSLGDEVYSDEHTPGGTTLANHAANPTVYAKINSTPWDFVVLQAQSQEPAFSDGQVNSQTLPYAIQLADSVYANRFCSDVMMFMTWGRENGDPQWAPISTFDGMNSRLRSAYIRMADSVQGSVSPVGSAWKYVRDNYPTINLYSGDGSHPSPEGTYLAACTFYASLFRKSPVGATYLYTLDPITAGILQETAELTVLDSLDLWNLRPISEHTQADFSYLATVGSVQFDNLSTKAQTYEWNFGDGNTSTDENPLHSYLANGVYSVTLIAYSECDSDTNTYLVNINSLGATEEELNEMKLFAVADNLYRIVANEQILSARLFDTLGKEILFVYPKEKELTVDLRGSALGVYLIIIQTEKGKTTLRLLK